MGIFFINFLLKIIELVSPHFIVLDQSLAWAIEFCRTPLLQSVTLCTAIVAFKIFIGVCPKYISHQFPFGEPKCLVRDIFLLTRPKTNSLNRSIASTFNQLSYFLQSLKEFMQWATFFNQKFDKCFEGSAHLVWRKSDGSFLRYDTKHVLHLFCQKSHILLTLEFTISTWRLLLGYILMTR